ncbi:YihY/virulence factor BrkB family protein [Conexibacter sp. SYSU D00693]|uniref:YihY/virulence factor BrkB family protein n=1 Tax=Conexibacter sp. SYSU D00693 TaxID=2812560 RepID=UPI00196A2923|nr:YihY/virulence factor BrkB family protein [Conexibacter sp. SYSU D00693]
MAAQPAPHVAGGDAHRLPSSRTVDAPPAARLWPAAKRAFAQFRADQLTDRAASMTYYAMLALAPTLVAAVSMFGLVADPQTVTNFVDFLARQGTDVNTQRTVNEMMSKIIESSGGAAGATFVISLLIALNGASGAFSAAGRGLNDVYNVEEDRSFVRHKLQDVGLTLAVLVLLLAVVVAVFLGGGIAEDLAGEIGLGSAAVTVWNIARWPIAAVLGLVIVALVMAFAPDIKPRKIRWLTPGAVGFIVLWLLASLAFGFYVRTFGSYAAYGAVGAAVVLLLYIWLTCCVFLLAAELNAEMERQESAGRGGPPFVSPPPSAPGSVTPGGGTAPGAPDS